MLRCPIKRRPISVAASANTRIYGFAVAYHGIFVAPCGARIAEPVARRADKKRSHVRRSWGTSVAAKVSAPEPTRGEEWSARASIIAPCAVEINYCTIR